MQFKHWNWLILIVVIKVVKESCMVVSNHLSLCINSFLVQLAKIYMLTIQSFLFILWHSDWPPGIILWMHQANERWRYIVTLSLIGWACTQNDHVAKEVFVAGLHKIEIGLGTKFQDKFSAWFSRNFMLSGKGQNVHFF